MSPPLQALSAFVLSFDQSHEDLCDDLSGQGHLPFSNMPFKSDVLWILTLAIVIQVYAMAAERNATLSTSNSIASALRVTA